MFFFFYKTWKKRSSIAVPHILSLQQWRILFFFLIFECKVLTVTTQRSESKQCLLEDQAIDRPTSQPQGWKPNFISSPASTEAVNTLATTGSLTWHNYSYNTNTTYKFLWLNMLIHFFFIPFFIVVDTAWTNMPLLWPVRMKRKNKE